MNNTIIHGHRSKHRTTTEYDAYKNAKQRCQYKKGRSYKDYGGRGIEFRFKSFQHFLSHIGVKPSPDLTLDRVNNDGHYEEGNVRWATRKEQTLTRRKPT